MNERTTGDFLSSVRPLMSGLEGVLVYKHDPPGAPDAHFQDIGDRMVNSR